MAESETSVAIRKQLEQLNRDLKNQVDIQNEFGRTGEQAIGQSYAELGTKLGSNLGDIRRNVDTGRTGINSAYSNSSQNISDAESTVRQLLGSSIDSGKFSSPLAEIQRLSAENATGRANSLGSYEQLGIGHINAGTKAIGDAATEGTNRQADLKSQIAAEIGELQRSHLSERSAMEVQLSQVLDAERARREQMALEREKMAQSERLAALARSGSGGGSKDYGKGRSGLLAWAAENKIGKKELDLIMQSIQAGKTIGNDAASYRYANNKSQPPKLGWMIPKNVQNQIAPRPDLDTINTGLDIYFGAYS